MAAKELAMYIAVHVAAALAAVAHFIFNNM